MCIIQHIRLLVNQKSQIVVKKLVFVLFGVNCAIQTLKVVDISFDRVFKFFVSASAVKFRRIFDFVVQFGRYSQ
jgi:hypothetical protein